MECDYSEELIECLEEVSPETFRRMYLRGTVEGRSEFSSSYEKTTIPQRDLERDPLNPDYILPHW